MKRVVSLIISFLMLMSCLPTEMLAQEFQFNQNIPQVGSDRISQIEMALEQKIPIYESKADEARLGALYKDFQEQKENNITDSNLINELGLLAVNGIQSPNPSLREASARVMNEIFYEENLDQNILERILTTYLNISAKNKCDKFQDCLVTAYADRQLYLLGILSYSEIEKTFSKDYGSEELNYSRKMPLVPAVYMMKGSAEIEKLLLEWIEQSKDINDYNKFKADFYDIYYKVDDHLLIKGTLDFLAQTKTQTDIEILKKFALTKDVRGKSIYEYKNRYYSYVSKLEANLNLANLSIKNPILSSKIATNLEEVSCNSEKFRYSDLSLYKDSNIDEELDLKNRINFGYSKLNIPTNHEAMCDVTTPTVRELRHALWCTDQVLDLALTVWAVVSIVRIGSSAYKWYRIVKRAKNIDRIRTSISVAQKLSREAMRNVARDSRIIGKNMKITGVGKAKPSSPVKPFTNAERIIAESKPNMNDILGIGGRPILPAKAPKTPTSGTKVLTPIKTSNQTSIVKNISINTKPSGISAPIQTFTNSVIKTNAGVITASLKLKKIITQDAVNYFAHPKEVIQESEKKQIIRIKRKVMTDPDGNETWITETIYIDPESEKDLAWLEELSEDFNVEIDSYYNAKVENILDSKNKQNNKYDVQNNIKDEQMDTDEEISHKDKEEKISDLVFKDPKSEIISSKLVYEKNIKEPELIQLIVKKWEIKNKISTEINLDTRIFLKKKLKKITKKIEEMKKALGYKNLVIASITDTHTALYPNGDNGDQVGGFSAIKHIVDKLKKEGKEVLFIDSGDFIEGTLEAEGKDGMDNIITALNELSLEYSVLGNHDIIQGTKNIEHIISNTNFQILGANMFEKETKKHPNGTKPYSVIEKNGVRIGIIGLANDYKNDSDFSFTNYQDATRDAIEQLKTQDTDFNILIMHDHTNVLAQNGFLSEIEGFISIVFGGHEHDIKNILDKETDILLVESGTATYGATFTNIEFNPNNEIVELSSNFKFLETNKFGEDKKIKKLIETFRVGGVDIPLGSIAVEMDNGEEGKGEATLPNFIADVQKSKMIDEGYSVDLSVVSIRAMRTDFSENEEITERKIAKLLIDNSNMAIVRVSADFLREFIIDSIREKGSLFAFSGAKVKYRWNKETQKPYNVEIYINGKALGKQEEYAIATHDIYANGNNQGQMFKQIGKEKKTFTNVNSRKILSEYIFEKGVIDFNETGRVVNQDLENEYPNIDVSPISMFDLKTIILGQRENPITPTWDFVTKKPANNSESTKLKKLLEKNNIIFPKEELKKASIEIRDNIRKIFAEKYSDYYEPDMKIYYIKSGTDGTAYSIVLSDGKQFKVKEFHNVERHSLTETNYSYLKEFMEKTSTNMRMYKNMNRHKLTEYVPWITFDKLIELPEIKNNPILFEAIVNYIVSEFKKLSKMDPNFKIVNFTDNYYALEYNNEWGDWHKTYISNENFVLTPDLEIIVIDPQ